MAGERGKKRQGDVAIAAFVSREDKMLSEMDVMLQQLLTERITADTRYSWGHVHMSKRWGPMGQHQG